MSPDPYNVGSNSFNEVPSTEHNVCTHDTKYNTDKNVVDACKNIGSNGYECKTQGSEKCKFNFYAAPEAALNKCTHQDS